MLHHLDQANGRKSFTHDAEAVKKMDKCSGITKGLASDELPFADGTAGQRTAALKLSVDGFKRRGLDFTRCSAAPTTRPWFGRPIYGFNGRMLDH